jgi:phospholipase C
MRRLLFAFLLLCLPLATQAQDTLKLLTWNIQMLPDGFRWFSSSLRKLQHIRQPWVADYVNQGEYDVIVFQEVLDKTMRRRLRRALKKSYPYQVSTKIKAGYLFSNGVLIVSRLPMKYLGHTIYKKGITADALAAKGCTLVEVQLKDKKIHIAGTHMQSGNSTAAQQIRDRQYIDIRQLFEKHQQENTPQLLAGDLNTERDKSPVFENMLAALNMQNFDINDPEPYTIDACNTWNDHEQPSQLDYIFLQKNSSPATITHQKIIRPQGEYKGKLMDYADHYGIGGWIVF